MLHASDNLFGLVMEVASREIDAHKQDDLQRLYVKTELVQAARNDG